VSVRTRLDARPPAMRGQPYAWLAIFMVFMIALRFVPDWASSQALVFNTWIVYTIMVVGFYFVFGVSGQFAFSQAAFAMVGGYTSAWAMREGADFLVAVAAGALVASVIAFAFAWVARKANLFFLAIATLALSEIIAEVIREWEQFTGQVGAEISGIASIELFGWAATSPDMSAATKERNIFWVYLGALAIVMLIGIWMARSPSKREAISMRDRDMVAATLGVPTLRLRITFFVLGSVIGAIAGSLYVHGRGYAQPLEFGVELALGVFVMLIVGGIDSLWGPVVGAAFYVWVPHFLTRADLQLFDHRIGEYNQIIYGLVLLLVMILMPEGIVGFVRRLARRLRGSKVLGGRRTWLSDFLGLTRRPIAEVPIPEPDLPPVTAGARARAAMAGATVERGAVLRADDIRVDFGGVKAVDGISLDVRQHEILGLVGPNGSGKTTFVNALVGVVPASGSLEVDGAPVRLGVPGASRRAGVLRTYQAPQTYDHLSCIEDVLISTSDRRHTGIVASWFLRPAVLRRERQRWGVAMDALTRVGLAEFAESPAGRLTYGQRRLLELARAIAGQPHVLLLDEPSAGLDASETEQLTGYLRALRDEGVSLLVIDHKLDFITGMCDRVAVLELGHLVAVGDAATVFEDRRVVDAYLGVAEPT
jgi:ABC-type branched-subunit amino acid transport system ATPase component/ABC-type branched-subunit amino acid transport system permease subunit